MKDHQIDDNFGSHVFNIDAQNKNKMTVGAFFNRIASKASNLVGHAGIFSLAILCVLFWAASGKYFHYSDSWQLVINTITAILTFLIVFLIQNTQNRDTQILNLKLDEIIRALKNANNHIINLSELSDQELKILEAEYMKLKDAKLKN